ncbi:MAG: cyclic nucleotide-binding domain-containing protein [Nitriliruptorales bacterium]|nr:cyclic nucleotide-binding domain-containing protein [Nitriliruptorales bacterium]
MRFGRKSQKAEALGEIPLFQNLSKKDLTTLASHVDEVEVDEGTELATQGKKGHQLSLLVEGSAKVVRNGRKLATLGPGDVIGEMSLIDRSEGTATVTTTEPSVVLVMHSRDFSQVLEESPAFARKIMAALVQRLRDADKKLVG